MLKLPLRKERLRCGFKINPVTACGYEDARVLPVVGVCAAPFGLLAPAQGADFAQFPPLGFSYLPIPPARLNAGRGRPQPASRSLTIRWRKLCFLTVDHQAGQQGGRSRPHLNCDPPHPPIARLPQAVVLLPLGEFALDVGTPALAVGLQSLMVGVGIVALVGRYVAGTWINQAHELLAVGHVPGRHRRRDQFAVRMRDSPGVSGPLLGES